MALALGGCEPVSKLVGMSALSLSRTLRGGSFSPNASPFWRGKEKKREN